MTRVVYRSRHFLNFLILHIKRKTKSLFTSFILKTYNIFYFLMFSDVDRRGGSVLHSIQFFPHFLFHFHFFHIIYQYFVINYVFIIHIDVCTALTHLGMSVCLPSRKYKYVSCFNNKSVIYAEPINDNILWNSFQLVAHTCVHKRKYRTLLTCECGVES